MKINNVSFGAKIPTTKCKIKDNKKDEFVDATVYEIDCRDYDEIKDIEKELTSLPYIQVLSRNMLIKYLRYKDKKPDMGEHFYTLEKNDGSILGMCQTSEEPNYTYVNFISSEQSNQHKYVGQNILASLGKNLIKRDGIGLLIELPIYSALGFYRKCGFEANDDDDELVMLPNDLKKLIQNTQNKTHSQIIDIKA